MTPDEELTALLGRARLGDRDAVAALFALQQPALLRFLRSQVGDAAEDVASQVWIEVMRALARFDDGADGFRALLFTIARRRVLDHRRSQRRRPAIPSEPTVLHARPDQGPGPEALAAGNVDAERAVGLLRAALPEEHVELLLLRVVADLSVDQVAAIVGKSPAAVRVQQHRALKRLAAWMEQHGVDHDDA